MTEFLFINKKEIGTINYMKKITYKYLLLAIIALLGGACDKEKGNFQIRDHAFYLNGKSVQLICGVFRENIGVTVLGVPKRWV